MTLRCSDRVEHGVACLCVFTVRQYKHVATIPEFAVESVPVTDSPVAQSPAAPIQSSLLQIGYSKAKKPSMAVSSYASDKSI